MKLPKITNKQSEIIELLYRYRFLDRIQIQALLGHKDKKTINLWLRDLKAKQYIDWIYSPDDFALKTKPAIYFLSINGIRHLKTITWTDSEDTTKPYYPIEQLRKRYKEATRSQSYVERCLLLADCSLGFKQPSAMTNTSKSTNTNIPTSTIHYDITTQADYIDEDNEYHFLTDGDLESQLGPQLVVSKHRGKKTTANYLLEAFDANLPRYRMKQRLKQYVTFLTEGDWEAAREDDDPMPTILLICPRTSDLIYAKRLTRGILGELYDDERKKIHIRFAAMQNLRTRGVMAPEIWDEA
jgi:hypothetical protein